MSNDSVLKSGLVGYVYRWLRNAGVVLFLSGAALVAVNAFQAFSDGRATATVTGLEIDCVLQGQGIYNRYLSAEIDCNSPNALKAAASGLPVVLSEVTYARLAYQSEIGADYAAQLSLEALGLPNLQRGDTVTILYSRNDPSEVRALPTRAQYKRGSALLGGGLLMLLLVWIARRAATFESDVGAEVAALEQAYRKAATRPAPASLGGSRQVPGKRRP